MHLSTGLAPAVLALTSVQAALIPSTTTGSPLAARDDTACTWTDPVLGVLTCDIWVVHLLRDAMTVQSNDFVGEVEAGLTEALMDVANGNACRPDVAAQDQYTGFEILYDGVARGDEAAAADNSQSINALCLPGMIGDTASLTCWGTK
ncbi:Uu.00g114550.m01.CDS01 [Anthostomella pinea]|uniref:Uu.00g114550.m01.CDS01 n=1 Tax=Anthostomella pinea TaxID=933095 RepID=A0AAI8VGD8_9PEZI|nr:Uu.00g114550.m01.CDS01 [Anthostomella pinea]